MSYLFSRYGHFSGINRKIQFKYLGSSRLKPEKSPCEDRGRHGYSSGNGNDVTNTVNMLQIP
jgi:hypothetical protein